MERRHWVIRVGLAMALLLIAGRAVSVLVVESAWYDALGLSALFREIVLDRVMLQGGAWLLGAAFAWANLRVVRRTIRAVAVPARVANLEVTAILPEQRLDGIILALALLIGVCLAWPLDNWTSVDLLRHGVPFGEIEGILGRDLGFYVYQLPLEEAAYLWAVSTVLVVALVVFVLYAMTRSLRLSGRRLVMTAHARRHFSVLGALLLLLLAWSFRLDGFDLLFAGSGHDGLFTRVDHAVALPMDRILVMLCVVAAPVCLRAGWLGNVRVAFAMVSGLLLTAVGGRQLIPALVARSGWLGSMTTDTRAYETTRALHSRRAYNADGIRLQRATLDTGALAQTSRLTPEELGRSVSLWDVPVTVAGTTTTVDEAAAPTFTGTGRTADGHLAALTARHVAPATSTAPAGGRWTLTLTDLTQPVSTEQPIPWPTGSTGALPGADPVLVGPGVVGHRLTTDADSAGGAPLTPIWRRIAFAWALRDAALITLDAEAVSHARLVFIRDVRERLERIAPIFAQSEAITPVLHEGRLTWVVQLYSSSDRYPLSQHLLLAGAERSYFRLAATAFVDAATGQIRILPVPRPDAIARSWLPRLRPLLVRTEELPTALIQQLPPATDGALAQVVTLVQYGTRHASMRGRQVLEGTLAGGAPPPHLMPTRGGLVPAWSLPLMDGDGQLAGVLTAVGGAERLTLWDSTRTPRSRWSALTDRLRDALQAMPARDLTVDPAEDFVLDTIPAATAQLGQVHIVPGAQGPVLWQTRVGPRRTGGTMIRAVAVVDGTETRVDTTLQALYPSASNTGRPTRGTDRARGDAGEDGAAIGRWYDAMRTALQRGDWGRFGAAFDSLGRHLGRTPPPRR